MAKKGNREKTETEQKRKWAAVILACLLSLPPSSSPIGYGAGAHILLLSLFCLSVYIPIDVCAWFLSAVFMYCFVLFVSSPTNGAT